MSWSWFPENVSTTGHLIDNLFYLAFYLITVTFAIVLGLLIYFLIRYRSRKNHLAYYTKGNGPKAVVLTLTLAVIVFLVIDLNLAFHDSAAWEIIWAKPDPGKALELRVEPEQFVWNAQYAGPDSIFDTADDVKVMNDLHIPIGRPILVSLKSRDVIHSFFLPNFRIKQDAVPGIVTHLTFEAIKKGVYEIVCAQLCGLGHYRMRGELTVDSQEDFKKWISDNSSKGPSS